ncbi:MAG: hypothetical protein BroJett011_75910 [Chloroflexota bacterium]|nr:MAG: hypothetical protein BroJett011_75910 [Chloroflexota bacterium]
MLPGLGPSDPQAQKERDERRKRIIIALLFLLLSFSCIFCSSQSALWFINRDRVETSMRSNLRADYGLDPALSLAPLSESIIAEAAQDEAALLAKQTPIAVGLGVVVLPNPVPTPAPTLIALLPTPTPTLTPTVSAPSNPAPATPVAPTTTSVPPTSAPPTSPPASPPPTSLPSTVPPTTLPPTLPPPTVPPTVPPPTVPPPTVPPPTVPPPTVPPTTVPPTTVPPTATATNIPPTATPIPPTVAFSAAAYSVNENGGNAVITVVLSAASSQTVTVTYAAADGTATAGSDYTPTGGLLTFAPGQTSQAFNVAIINDTIASEGNETVLLSLSNPTNATLGLSSATLTIADDDAPPTVQFSQAGYTVGEAGGPALIDVTLSTASAVTVTVNFATAAGSATSGVDYQDNSGTLTFAPGQVSQSFNVTINDDALDEADETVDLSLSAPVNAALGTQNTAVLTITDDDASPTIQFSNSNYNVTEANTTVPIDVTLSAVSALTVTVDYATSDITAATADGDYSTATGQLTFPPGSTSQTFSVTINDDTLDEPNETVGLTLSNFNGATPGSPTSATLTIVDNDNPGTCSGLYPNGEPNIGSPNGTTARIACDVGMIIDLGTIISTGHPGYDLVYYEMQGNPPPPPPYYVYLDLVEVEIGQTPSGPWYPIFVWGDGNSDTNTNISGLDGGPSSDNATILSPPLVGPGDPLNTGVQIDIDTAPGGPPPAGSYQYIRIYSPLGGANDGPEVDAIQALP